LIAAALLLLKFSTTDNVMTTAKHPNPSTKSIELTSAVTKKSTTAQNSAELTQQTSIETMLIGPWQ